MKHIFVLDENVVILAQKGENKSGQEDYSSIQLVSAILENCHALALTWEQRGIYLSQLNDSRHRGAYTPPISVPALLSSILRDNTKDNRLLNEEDLVPVPNLDEVSSIDENDKSFTRVACTVGGILVTTDNDIKEGLEDASITQAFGINVLGPKEALSSARET